MTPDHKKQLVRIGLGVALGIPLVLSAWIVIGRATGMDVVRTCRYAGLSSMLLLGTSIVLPLALNHPWPARLRGYAIFWFAISAAFNLVWELPLVVFKSTITGIEVTSANLPYAIAWWGYTLSDSIYRQVTPFMITIELTWLVANAIAVVGLVLVRRGESIKGYLWLGVAGALQAYNASLYVLANGIMDHYSNVASDTLLAPVLYWGFNLLWTCAAAVGSIIAFRLVLDGKARLPARAAS
jgi:hypothetical protein